MAIRTSLPLAGYVEKDLARDDFGADHLLWPVRMDVFWRAITGRPDCAILR
ncbi:MAG: hypothetical protein R8K53_03315 [Mariprofundaceae bacterium]